MEYSLATYFMLFIIYAVAGWICEVTLQLIQKHKLADRGFLIGPYCPIYGWGVVLITILLYKYAYDPLVLFVMTIITCMILEYVTSFIMEKLFKARWWDYSKRKFNLNGRVCLGTTIPFGIFGVFIIYFSNPFIVEQLNKVDPTVLDIIAIIILIIYIIDNIISGIVIFGFRKTAVQVNKEGRQDNTEEITRKVREILSSKAWTYKRLVNAYPKLVTIKYRIKEIKNEVKENAQEIKNNINEKAQDMKHTLNGKRKEAKLKIHLGKENIKRKFKVNKKD